MTPHPQHGEGNRLFPMNLPWVEIEVTRLKLLLSKEIRVSLPRLLRFMGSKREIRSGRILTPALSSFEEEREKGFSPRRRCCWARRLPIHDLRLESTSLKHLTRPLSNGPSPSIPLPSDGRGTVRRGGSDSRRGRKSRLGGRLAMPRDLRGFAAGSTPHPAPLHSRRHLIRSATTFSPSDAEKEIEEEREKITTRRRGQISQRECNSVQRPCNMARWRCNISE